MALAKMKTSCQLEERHGAQLGKEYNNEFSCSTFVKYI